MKTYDYTINGTFNTNDGWTETAHGLDQLRWVIKKLLDNPTVCEWKLTRDDNPRDVLYTDDDAYKLVGMLDTVDEFGSDVLASDDWDRLVTLTDDDTASELAEIVGLEG